jgi:hypothetical protein
MSGDVGREEDDELVGGRRDRQDGVVDMPLWRRRSRVDVMVGPLFFAVGGARRRKAVHQSQAVCPISDDGAAEKVPRGINNFVELGCHQF